MKGHNERITWFDFRLEIVDAKQKSPPVAEQTLAMRWAETHSHGNRFYEVHINQLLKRIGCSK
jgi:hypothetical protein